MKRRQFGFPAPSLPGKLKGRALRKMELEYGTKRKCVWKAAAAAGVRLPAADVLWDPLVIWNIHRLRQAALAVEGIRFRPTLRSHSNIRPVTPSAPSHRSAKSKSSWDPGAAGSARGVQRLRTQRQPRIPGSAPLFPARRSSFCPRAARSLRFYAKTQLCGPGFSSSPADREVGILRPGRRVRKSGVCPAVLCRWAFWCIIT